MKPTSLAVVMAFHIFSACTLAAQTAELKERPATPSNSMMQEMIKGGKDGEHMGAMMRMTKMMDQCSAMLESAKADSGEPQPGQKQ